ncbi:unnamed protein product [Alopecurus aequalis]
MNRQSYRRKVLVRLARMWEFRDQQTGTVLYELDFVVIDRQGGTMEGCIPNNRIDQFKEQLKEGSVYTFEQFVLSDARRLYKSVEHQYRIRFTQRTKVKEILSYPQNFPMYAYTIKPFDVLATRMNNNTLLSDVIGLITAISEASVSPSTQQNKRQIFITNGSQRAIVTLHDSWPIFCTKDYAHQIEWQGSAQPKGDPIDITISDLIASDPYEKIGECFKIKVIITSVVTTERWWYLSCKSCWKKLALEGGVLKCPRCSGMIGEPRYKLVLEGTDMEYGNIENPKVAHFTFFGQQGVAITGKEAELLVPDVTAEMTDIPPQIMALVGKKYILIADLAEGSLDADELCFQVSSIEEINDGQSEKASSQATVNKLHQKRHYLRTKVLPQLAVADKDQARRNRIQQQRKAKNQQLQRHSIPVTSLTRMFKGTKAKEKVL